MAEQTKTAFGGLVNQKLRWSLSWKGWLLSLLVSVAFVIGSARSLDDFLAVQHPLKATVLVVEGWMADYNTNALALEFHRGKYERVYTTGGAVDWANADNYAEYSAKLLQMAGIPARSIVAVPSTGRDWARTYQSAAALNAYFRSNHCVPKNLNVVTVGPHARRSRLQFQRVLGHESSVGIISLPRDDYDEAHWWRSSTGVREVISEFAAYLYCRVVPSSFSASEPSRE
jgi:uncharacterized SAM-binding protein YcdF (DUF218 family)